MPRKPKTDVDVADPAGDADDQQPQPAGDVQPDGADARTDDRHDDGVEPGTDRPSEEAQVGHGIPQHAPAQEMSGRTHDTTEDNFVAPGGELEAAQEASTSDNEFHVLRLATFLHEQFPGQYERTNTQQPEHPVDVAIRLLQGMATAQPNIEHCPEAYCNKNKGHQGEHGWVVYQPNSQM